MENHRFHLQKYRPGSKTTCPECGRKRCFTRYVDECGEIEFPEYVGICDHINSCGYHFSPKQYFADHPQDWKCKLSRHSSLHQQSDQYFQRAQSLLLDRNPIRKFPSQSTLTLPSFIDKEIMEKSLGYYEINPLYKYLCRFIEDSECRELMRKYCVGTAKKWGGSAIFWQVDASDRIRTGKIILYDPTNGHRVKEPVSRICWAHSELRLKDFNLRQCLFGEHLLGRYPGKVVGLVESEKTALIAAHFVPEIVWVATGGMKINFSSESMLSLKGRKVVMFPDLGATQVWKEKQSMLKSICSQVSVSTILEENCTQEQKHAGLDIADYLLMQLSPRQKLRKMVAANPEIQLLIDALGLVLIE